MFITPTLDHALAVIDAGADILALDATDRTRPDGRSLAETVEAIRARSDIPLMADCDSADSARRAAELGIEIIGTTLAGYTPARERTAGPDLAPLGELTVPCPRPAARGRGPRAHPRAGRRREERRCASRRRRHRHHPSHQHHPLVPEAVTGPDPARRAVPC